MIIFVKSFHEPSHQVSPLWNGIGMPKLWTLWSRTIAPPITICLTHQTYFFSSLISIIHIMHRALQCFFLFSFQYWSKDWEAWIIPESNTTLRLEVIPYTSAYVGLVLVLKQNRDPFEIYSLDHFHDRAAQQKRAEQSRQSNFSTQILGKPLFPSATHAGAAQSKTHVDAFQNVSTAAINAQVLRKNNFQQRPSVRKSPQSSGSAW